MLDLSPERYIATLPGRSSGVFGFMPKLASLNFGYFDQIRSPFNLM